MKELIGSIDPLYTRIAVFIMVAVFLIVSAKMILNRFYPVLKEQNRWYSISKAVMNTIYVSIFLIFLFTFSDRFEGFYATIGLAGAGIAFALRDVIVSVAGWFAILFGDLFDVGDRVLLGGIKGDVMDLGVLRTTIMEMGDWVDGDQYNGRIVRVANSSVFASPVYNYSASFQFVWDEIRIPIRFGSDVKLVREILTGAADEVMGSVSPQAEEAWSNMRRKFKLEDAKLEHQIFMVFNDNWIEFALRYVVDVRERRVTKDRLFTRLLEEIEKNRGIVELASETLEIVQKSKR